MRSIHWFFWRLHRSWALLRLYWSTCDGDWSTIALLMRFQIRRTRETIAYDNIIDDVDRTCRQMLIAETLLTRMLEDASYDIADQRYPNNEKHWAQMVASLNQQNDEMLATILRKHFRKWWD